MNTHIIIYTLPLLAALAVSCGTTRHAETTAANTRATVGDKPLKEWVESVADAAPASSEYLTSKVKVRAKMGKMDMPLSGTLRMKRGDVVQLQLVAYGIMEAARLEITPQYILLIDRINKQYVKETLDGTQVSDFTGLSFHTLQSLFWNELFYPGSAKPAKSHAGDFKVAEQQTERQISAATPVVDYQWTTDRATAAITRAALSPKVLASAADYAISWQYADFQPFASRKMPRQQIITVHTPKQDITLNITLKEPAADRNWETRTTVSAKYKRVELEDILKMFGKL